MFLNILVAVDGSRSSHLALDSAVELARSMGSKLTIATVPALLAASGDPWAGIDEEPQSLEPLLELYERDRAAGLMDAPWPPVYPKQPDEPPRVAPSRAKRT